MRDIQILASLLVATHYTFTGIANGGGYAGRSFVQYVGVAGQVILTGLVLSCVPLSFVNIALATLSITCFALNKLSFDNKVGFGDTHLFTYLGTMFFCLLVCYDLSVFGLLGVYAGLLLEKGLINIGSDMDFFDDRTDDESGKTFGIPSLGIKISRIKTEYRIPLAVLSLVCVGLTSIYKINFTLHQLITNI